MDRITTTHSSKSRQTLEEKEKKTRSILIAFNCWLLGVLSQQSLFWISSTRVGMGHQTLYLCTLKVHLCLNVRDHKKKNWGDLELSRHLISNYLKSSTYILQTQSTSIWKKFALFFKKSKWTMIFWTRVWILWAYFDTTYLNSNRLQKIWDILAYSYLRTYCLYSLIILNWWPLAFKGLLTYTIVHRTHI